MRVIVVGAGAVGATAVESLYNDHDCTGVDLDPVRLKTVSDSFDVRVVQGDGAGREALEEARAREFSWAASAEAHMASYQRAAAQRGE